MVFEVRKLQKTVDGTFFVTLPKSWVAVLGLKQGDTLSFLREESGKLIIQPYSGELKREIEAVILKPSDFLEREIGENYLLGADVIEIRSEDFIQSSVRERVKKIIKRLIGLEIVEEGSRKIIIQCLLEPSLVTPDKMLKRLHLISLEMVKDSLHALLNGNVNLAKVVVERDEEVDRMYFLLVRIIRITLLHPLLSEKASIKPIDCLDYRMLASLIEHFADYATFIAETCINYGLTPPKELTDLLSEIEKIICNCYEKAFEAVLSKNLKLTLEVSSESKAIEEIIRALENKLYSINSETREKLMPLISAFNYMKEICVDIADLTRTK
ncbi:phosphate uptake regulator PhoU [Candidatus Bathyarchaeota archaeon]|nr:phosphate uptake regulator PhoU [Candidatus Bathyarchaeota archaeon]